jgi:hypothetical protein
MAATRTVDPAGIYRSTKMVSLRLTTIQMEHIVKLCEKRGVSRSLLFRQLLAEEMSRV